MAKHGLEGCVRVLKSESFKIGSKVYVPMHRISSIFNRRGNSAVANFDKDDFIIHPVKGKLYLYPGKVIRENG
jgi:hypothetical protein